MEEKKSKSFWKRQGSNILLVILIALFIIPQTRKPLAVGINRLFSFAPSEIAEEKREVLTDYQWQLQKLSGERISFEEAEGQIAVVNLWATWCPPCIAEMPSFQKVFDDYGEKVNFYFVSQEERKVLEAFLEKRELNLPIYQALTVSPKQLESNSLPTTYVISKSGEIVIKKIGAADWNSQGFRKLLEEMLRE